MASLSTHDEKSNFGIIVEQDENHHETHDNNLLSAENVFDTPKTSLSRSTTRDATPSPPNKPCPAARGTGGKSLLRVDTASTMPDLEKGCLSAPPSSTRDPNQPSPLYGPCREYSISSRVKECSMWPSKQTLKHKARKEKLHRRGRTCCGLSQKWGVLDKKTKLTIKILLALVLIGVAIGVAVGISKAVHGGVYAGQNATKQIPDGH